MRLLSRNSSSGAFKINKIIGKPLILDVCLQFVRERKNHINVNIFGGLSPDRVGWQNYVMCLLGSFLMWERKHINKKPENPGTTP